MDTQDTEPEYAAFLSFAGEDAELARQIADALRDRGLRLWYAETELKAGDSLLTRVNRGLQASERGILLISKAYLAKAWPRYELSVLMRQRIDADKGILPIWHGVTKAEVEEANPGLADVYALNTERGFPALIRGLEQVLMPTAVTLARTSSWEDPLHRFLEGVGEATLLGGGTFTLWEAIIHFTKEQFPLRINDETYSREELMERALMDLTGDLSSAQIRWLRSIGYHKVLDVLKEEGLDLSIIGYQELPEP